MSARNERVLANIRKGFGYLPMQPSRHAPPDGPISRAEHFFAGIVVEYAA